MGGTSNRGRAVLDYDSVIPSITFLQESRKARVEAIHSLVGYITEWSSFTQCLGEAPAAFRRRLFGGRVQHPIKQKVGHGVSQISEK